MLPFGQLGANDDILHMLHTEMIPEKEERDLIREIHRQFGTMLRNKNRSPLDSGMSRLTVILPLGCWLGLLTSRVDCWVTCWLNSHSLWLSDTLL